MDFHAYYHRGSGRWTIALVLVDHSQNLGTPGQY